MDVKLGRITLALIFGAALVGCAPGQGGGTYGRTQARAEHTVRMGTVENVRPVTIEGTRSGIGGGAGAVVGGIGGSTIGHGRGSAAAAVVGAVIGGIAGQAAEELGTRRSGVEVTVKLDNGNFVAITQEADETFEPGERVRIVSGGGVSRVTH